MPLRFVIFEDDSRCAATSRRRERGGARPDGEQPLDLVVGLQVGGHVDVVAEEVVDRVLVLGTSEPAQRRCAGLAGGLHAAGDRLFFAVAGGQEQGRHGLRSAGTDAENLRHDAFGSPEST